MKKKKWIEADKIIKMIYELPEELKEYDKIMKEKPNFNKQEDVKNERKK